MICVQREVWYGEFIRSYWGPECVVGGMAS
jgi:hypothetical protein